MAVTDAFMEATAGESYPLVDPRDGEPVGEKDAREVLEKICEAAWRTGDPGLFFLDTTNRSHPLPHLAEIESTNPCGEIPLLPYESCNLGSINLARFVKRNGDDEAGERTGGDEVADRDGAGPHMDWDDLADAVRTGLRFLDDVVEVNRYPLEETEERTRANRKVGLGVMGFAEALVKLEVSYDSNEAVELAEEISSFVAEHALEVSKELAESRGVFPSWEGSRLEEEGLRVRNATRTAVAPTGTIGIIAGASPSIEPFFSPAYRRTNVLSGQTLVTVNPLLEKWAERYGVDVDRIVKRVRREGTLEAVEDVPDGLRRLFVTAQEIPPTRHLEIQAAFQRHVDNAVSKTINLPEDAAVEDVVEIYRRAWELGLKGITIFRHRSNGRQVLKRGAGEGED